MSGRRTGSGTVVGLVLWLGLAVPAAAVLARPGGAPGTPAVRGTSVPPGASGTGAAAAPAGTQQVAAADLMQQVGIDQNLGAELPAELTFTDSEGTEVRLGDLFGERPVILALVYYECPMLCTVSTEGLLSALRPLSLELGEDFDVVTVSIDPGETPDVAAAEKATYVEEYGRHHEGTGDGWHALTGDAEAIAALADVVGFRYVYDEQRDMYAHAAGIVVVTPARTLARYFYGVVYPTRDLRLALVEASGGAVGNRADQVLLLCYQYDPVKGKYGFVVWGAVRVLGVATVLALAGFIVVMLRRERQGGPQDPTAGAPGGGPNPAGDADGPRREAGGGPPREEGDSDG